MAGIDRRHRPSDACLAILAVDLNVHHHGEIGRQVLISGRTQPASFAGAGRQIRLPAGKGCGGFDDGDGAWIIQMPYAEFHGIVLHRPGAIVHETLNGEDFGISAQRPQRRDADQNLRDEMMRHALAWKIVNRDSIPVAAADQLRNDLRRLWLRQMPRSQQVTAIFLRPYAMRVGPDIERPIDDHAGSSRLPRTRS